MNGSKSREYIRPMPATWWLKNRYLVQFMIRELTAVFVAAYAVLLLIVLYKAAQGEEAFKAFYKSSLQCPACIGFQLICLAFVLYHTITWFNLTPKALVIWRGDEKVSPVLIAGANYVAWLAVSVVILLLVAR